MSMACPRCGGPTRTPDSRTIEGGAVVQRLRLCRSSRCSWSFSTRETACEGSCPAFGASERPKKRAQKPPQAF